MFTGLVEGTGVLRDRTLEGDAGKLLLHTPLATEMAPGDSIAVNGTCLTVEEIDGPASCLRFHTLQQTLNVTNLGSVQIGGKVNLERPLRVGDRLGGHLVLGHVDGTAAILGVERLQDDWVVEVTLPDPLFPLAIDKGSICLDGISLTIAELRERSFTVHIIPYTWEITNLCEARAGKLVNLEMDMVGKYVLRREQLNEQGFDV